jgi:endonuclease/exonuclease/phosphatase (EEP) superfamily protein YafD
MFKRLSGLRDPRVGRGLFNTFHASYPLFRYPVDHIFVSPGTGLAALERVEVPGSDHFGMLVSLDLDHAMTPAESRGG